MSVSLIIILALIVLVMLGTGQRILDSMRLTDKQALLVLLSIAIGLVIPSIYIGPYFCFSIGGFVIPFIICVYLLVSCGPSRDLVRSIIGTVLVAGFCIALDYILPAEPESLIIEPMFIYGIVAGLTAYLLGRSRRNAFISAILGINLAAIIMFLINLSMGIKTVLGLGTGGAFGTTIVACLISVSLAEFIGRMMQTAKPDKQKKNYNFDTKTYDSEKNQKLKTKNNKVKERAK